MPTTCALLWSFIDLQSPFTLAYAIHRHHFANKFRLSLDSELDGEICHVTAAGVT